MQNLKRDGKLHHEVDAILRDMGVKKWDDAAKEQLLDFVQREAVELLQLSTDNFNIANTTANRRRGAIEREDAAMACEVYMEHWCVTPRPNECAAQMASEINSLSIGAYPVEPGVHLHSSALVASYWTVNSEGSLLAQDTKLSICDFPLCTNENPQT
eukprot:Lankesteria_metandrocarpae@DN2170_c0_g1_i1.p1